MRVEIKIIKETDEPYAIIYTKEINEEINQILKYIENPKENLLTVKRDEKIFIVNIRDIQIVRTEGGEVVVYTGTKDKFYCNKRLYEIEAMFNNDFIRISKCAIVNLLKIDHVDTNIIGTLDIVMRNGCIESISRRYLKAFKMRIGI